MKKHSMKRQKVRHYSGIGGQAVLEGVMMKNKDMYSVAVRKPDGEIVVELDEYHGPGYANRLKDVPLIRGIITFADSLILGLKSLNYSSSFYEETAEKPSKLDKGIEKVTQGHEDTFLMLFTTLLSFFFAIVLFMIIPYAVSELLSGHMRNRSMLAIIEGVLRIIIFIVYILVISRVPDIKRLFMYHGAEHKCINCIENGKELTVENVRKSSRLHNRCGSSFILFVMLVSIILFFFIRVDSVAARVGIRILLIPVISGISYEILRLSGRFNFFLLKLISAPGLWLQKLTTKEPDDDMIEVAIKSVEAVFDWKEFMEDSFGYSFNENNADLTAGNE